MKIGILYIRIGKYNIFWEDFYDSCERFFLCTENKEYFVFTDAEKLKNEENDNVHKIYQVNLGWPGNTLMRFQMFDSIAEELKKMQYLFFFNANLLFVKEINQEILPEKENLVVVIHPGFRNSTPQKFPYERNPRSLAYVPYCKGEIYVQGALNGGKTEAYLQMTKNLKENILQDKSNQIIAVWHDESHLNHYIIDRRDLKILGPEYVNQEGKDYGVEPMIISRNKDRFMQIDDLRGIKRTPIEKSLKLIKQIVKKILGRK